EEKIYLKYINKSFLSHQLFDGKFSDEKLGKKLDKKLGKKPEVLRQIFPFKYFFVFERSLILAIS
ncbi:MAG: hypothetical protein O4751_07200, partial [Trichodesmium sp. St2_bin6]|nr:hypothetical protein [Trichodesmium sp. St2_bin6]